MPLSRGLSAIVCQNQSCEQQRNWSTQEWRLAFVKATSKYGKKITYSTLQLRTNIRQRRITDHFYGIKLINCGYMFAFMAMNNILYRLQKVRIIAYETDFSYIQL